VILHFNETLLTPNLSVVAGEFAFINTDKRDSYTAKVATDS